jgi:hypothetical protein
MHVLTAAKHCARGPCEVFLPASSRCQIVHRRNEIAGIHAIATF